jgi:hypothetical protein
MEDIRYPVRAFFCSRYMRCLSRAAGSGPYSKSKEMSCASCPMFNHEQARAESSRLQELYAISLSTRSDYSGLFTHCATSGKSRSGHGGAE